MAESKTRKPRKDEEIGGFNPERHERKKHPTVGPAPTDDPHHDADDDMKRKIEEKLTRLPPD